MNREEWKRDWDEAMMELKVHQKKMREAKTLLEAQGHAVIVEFELDQLKKLLDQI